MKTMSQEQISEEVRQFIVNDFLFGREAPFSNEDSFIEKGLIDSTGVLELIAFIEAKYNIGVLEEETIPDNLDSLRRLSTFIFGKLQSPVRRT
jgi:acyl carrier protein